MGGTRARILMCHQIATNRNSNTLRNLLQTDHQPGPITAQLRCCRFHNRSTVLRMCSPISTHSYFETNTEGNREVIWSFFSYWFSTTLAWCVVCTVATGFLDAESSRIHYWCQMMCVTTGHTFCVISWYSLSAVCWDTQSVYGWHHHCSHSTSSKHACP